MSHCKRSSKISIPITNLDFPDEFTHFKWKCSLTRTSPSKINTVKSSELGIPGIISIRKPLYRSSSYNSTSINVSPFNLLSINPSHVSTSRILFDTQHRKSVKATLLQFKKQCTDSVVLGAPISFIGKCPGRVSKEFKLTEDPRKRICLKNPNRIHYKPISQPLELAKIKELVNTAENVLPISESHSSNSSICEVIDLANPLGLDFQGTDYKNTYERDEQSCQNQIEYRKVCRLQHRRNVKLETVHNTEKEQQLERIAIPKHFVVDGCSVHAKLNLSLSKILNEKRHFHGKLVRAEQKPEVFQRLKEEEERRRERYKQLYVKKKLKTAEKYEKEIQTQKATAEEKATMLAEKDIQDFVNLLDRNIITKKMNLRQLPQQKSFPHNISETMKFRYDMKKSKRIIRDRAKVKQNVYEAMGIQKKIPETQLKVSADSCSPSNKSGEQSSNDEDDIVVGQKGSKFLLRGFRYKLGTNLRGKFNQNELPAGAGKVKGCITRTEWFESLFVSNIQRNEIKNDEMNLFPRQLGLEPSHAISAIREFKKKPLGHHYNRTIRKKLHIKKPKTVKARKFNLKGYLYGNTKRKTSLETITSFERNNNLRGCTLDYMRNKTEKEKLNQTIQNRRRMRYLGISCPQEQRRKAKFRCIDSDSGDSEWVPDDITNEHLSSGHIDLRMRGNMPAPPNRETTLRQHPKHPRDYKQLRVASALLDDFVQNQHIPVMRKLRDDRKVVENVRTVKNTEYANKFNARHHHDHWNPTQHKSINVRYSRKIVKPKLLEEKSEVNKKRRKVPLIFNKARPNSTNVDELHFSMPMLNIDSIKKHKIQSKGGDQGQIKVQELRQSKDMVIHSLVDGKFQEFPGRDKFLQFISEIKSELNKRSRITDTELVIDKRTFINELKEDLFSIESCLTSLSSSECTNLSNDSGSFLMAGDKKIPLDYLRKSVVPFEEMNRHRIEATLIDAGKEEMNPYKTVRFAGQQKEQLSMTTAKDNFFTFNARLQNGMRQRLEVKSEDPAKKLLGPNKGPKAIAQVATDIDEMYIEDLKNRPPLKLFKWNSSRTMNKDALRKKFESMLIQGEIVRTKINDHRDEEYFQLMIKSKELFEQLFAKWEKKEYEAAMEVVNKVKPYYEATDVYRKECQELSKQYTVLNMDIVFIENNWTSRTILQNFHYLLADMEWRVENDWIHRNMDGSLEGFQESIAKRWSVNIRQRYKDDAWAIKEYYEEIFLKNSHHIIVVFANAKEFVNGIDNLKSKTFVLLLELHFTLWILAELEQRYQEFNDWCTIELASKKKFAENKCANKYYMENRLKKLKDQVDILLADPIIETFADKQLSQMKGICNEMYRNLVPVADQMDLSALEQVAAISEVLNELLDKFENIPVTQRIRVEKKHRRMLAYRRNMSKQAVFIERRIASEMIKVQRNLAHPFQKPKREAKLQRSQLKKVIRLTHKKPFPISDQAKFFYKAFHDEGDPNGLKEARESLDVIDGIQQSIVPFYFDHFLEINGYQPSYDFKTQVELRDGPEIDRMQVKKLLPEVMEKYEKWLSLKKRIMEENIRKNPHMYQNVRI